MADRPLVIAHRGASAHRPESTRVAYEQAIEAGADGLECDVRRTRDGHLVCLHDRRIDRTSTGSGAVAGLTLAQLRRLDFGGWHDGEPAPILTFVELLELVRAADRPLRLLVETKHPTRSGDRIEATLVAALVRFGWTGASAEGAVASPVTVMSFSRLALRRIERRAPALRTVLLMDNTLGRRRIGLLPPSVGIAGPSIALLRTDPGYVERAQLLGNQVYVWTVDDPADVEFARRLGVDAVITNRPAEVIAALDQASPPTRGLESSQGPDRSDRANRRQSDFS
jgi:glycerophosphoryl diester phosphodiesterase